MRCGGGVVVSWCTFYYFIASVRGDGDGKEDNAPDKMLLIRHSSHCVDRARALLKFEGTICFASLAAKVVDGVLIDGVISSAGVDEVAV